METAGAFDYIVWRSLRNAPPLMEIFAEIVQFLSDQQPTALPNSEDETYLYLDPKVKGDVDVLKLKSSTATSTRCQS